MRTITLSAIIILFFTTSVFAASNLENQVREHEQRITQLEHKLEELQSLLEVEKQSSATETQQPTNSIVGRWDCSNGVFQSELYFEANGLFHQKEPVMGQTKTNRWVRLSHDKIALQNGQSFRLDDFSPDRFSIVNTNTRSSWECNRLND